MPPSDYRPTVDQVAAMLRARTTVGMSGEVGTFTDETRPTAAQVEALIDSASGEVSALVGETIPQVMWPAVRTLVARRAAMHVETSYFPEQVPTDRSPYGALRETYEAELPRIMDAVRAAGSGDDPGSVDDAKLPRWNRGGAAHGDAYLGTPDCVNVAYDGARYLRRFAK